MYYNDVIMYQSYYVCIMSVCKNPFFVYFFRHIDSNHKLIAWRFVFHGCIDGYMPISRSRHFEIVSEAPVGRNPEVKVNNNDLDYQPRAATAI